MGVAARAAAAGFAVASVLAFFPADAPAQDVCSGVTAGDPQDTDFDGLTDYQECQGISGADTGIAFAGGISFGGATSLPRCTTGTLRANCLDPNSKDFFVVFRRAGTEPCTTSTQLSCTWIPTNPDLFVSRALSAGGLGITVHALSEGAGIAGDRLVLAIGSGPRYLIVTESLAAATADDDDLGVGNVGTPGDPFAFATIFTRRIVDYHAGVYSNAGASAPVAERDLYILHTLTHEVSHNLDLCGCPDNPRYGGRHYKTGTFVVMEQSVKVTVKGSTVTFFISDHYPSTDQVGAHIVP
jgi:hypothetical protein